VREIVDDDTWQNLRVSLVGAWKTNPNMAVRKLRDYVGGGKDIARVVRVLNYLTGSGFRIGVIGNDQTDALREFCAKKYEQHRAPYQQP